MKLSLPQLQMSSVDLIRALGQLMQQYPTALLGTERLPAPKEKMKSVIKEVWKQGPKLSAGLDIAYLHLSQFQDGIGNAVLDYPDKNAANAVSPAALFADINAPNSSFQQLLAWEKVSMAEMEILIREWKEFEASNGA